MVSNKPHPVIMEDLWIIYNLCCFNNLKEGREGKDSGRLGEAEARGLFLFAEETLCKVTSLNFKAFLKISPDGKKLWTHLLSNYS